MFLLFEEETSYHKQHKQFLKSTYGVQNKYKNLENLLKCEIERKVMLHIAYNYSDKATFNTFLSLRTKALDFIFSGCSGIGYRRRRRAPLPLYSSFLVCYLSLLSLFHRYTWSSVIARLLIFGEASPLVKFVVWLEFQWGAQGGFRSGGRILGIEARLSFIFFLDIWRLSRIGAVWLCWEDSSSRICAVRCQYYLSDLRWSGMAAHEFSSLLGVL